ncbi:TetR/AcrR family transcriptional regulator [Liquorilactobacillus satsumensis]|uniref:TetR/AcrR family transcriptional regulator n=1 Tax=Liquorilactobacillus satsumensis TaxID=259059 RepID=UPI0021C30D8A|nr:helix-turn-helix domain-containing protein [Liquorilactobacillus satsumensis]MCP9313012.1 TetR/AcrR family transcriptional regulator [Liquorilactobacillus satsumensis]MCP9360168.1 TetR/AcrR family transcriptional regulator [Liquorilactobacillus satsumensis]
MTQKRRRGEELEQAIYQAALELLKTKGVANLSFSEVAALAQTSKSVIYRRWDSPFSLAISAIQAKIIAENNGRTDELILTGKSLRADLLQLLQRFIVSMQTFKDSNIVELLGAANQKQNSTVKKLINEGNAIDVKAIDHVLERAKKRGEVTTVAFPVEVKLLPFNWLRYHLFINEHFTARQLTILIDNILLPVYQAVV